ncbi:GNAT family N-acetyltransferase [Vibrio rumoiensis]|uniref:GNAT family N-acetyltransferase n=1 Tax=Vibrio rumoiensis 1S-45 TaxID=1188252 RepID=A0A1E5E484_9VIBR|nr:GNAT family N-acetyltransferase [Vibrio rumoiensis]OEF27540.1 GNAT family N-acetyltransferase [Vibrio rumoiensis 1S-45]
MKISLIADLGPYLQDLIPLLQDCVSSGASVGFLPPVKAEQAQQYWQGVQQDINDDSHTRLLLGAFENEKLVACVQLSLASKANALHRAEVEKLMVHTRYRGKGISKHLLSHLESEAQKYKRTLLVLDTRIGDVASDLYKRMGYTEAGQIPNFALSANGQLEGTVYFYKILE